MSSHCLEVLTFRDVGSTKSVYMSPRYDIKTMQPSTTNTHQNSYQPEINMVQPLDYLALHQELVCPRYTKHVVSYFDTESFH